MATHVVSQVLDHVMVGIEGITKERGHHLIRERCDMFSPFSLEAVVTTHSPSLSAFYRATLYQRAICCHRVSVRPSVRHKPVLYRHD